MILKSLIETGGRMGESEMSLNKEFIQLLPLEIEKYSGDKEMYFVEIEFL